MVTIPTQNITTRSAQPTSKAIATFSVCRDNGAISASGSKLDPTTLIEVETDSINLPLENFRGGEVALSKEMIMAMFERLMQYRRIAGK